MYHCKAVSKLNSKRGKKEKKTKENLTEVKRSNLQIFRSQESDLVLGSVEKSTNVYIVAYPPISHLKEQTSVIGIF